MLSIKVGLVLLISVVSASIYFYFSGENSDEYPTTMEKQDVVPDSAGQPGEVISTDKVVAVNNSDGLSNAQNNEAAEETHQQALKLEYFTKESFVSEQSFNDTFVNKQQAVVRATLDAVFQGEDFDLLLEGVKNIEKSQASMERLHKLNNTLYDLLDNNYFDEKVACAGKICLIEFKYSSGQIDNKLSEITTFDKNYSFISYGKPEDQGFNKFKAIYIATDDPSTLRLDR